MAEDLRSMLLQTLASRTGVSIPATAGELLAQLGQSDPTLSMIAQYYLTQRQTSDDKNGAAVDETEAAEVAEPAIELKQIDRSEEKAQAIRELRQKIDQMYAELQELRERNDTLAAALGACYACWGNDPGCVVCDGEGRTGSSLPERKWFKKFVSPAIHRLQKHQGEDLHFSEKIDAKSSSNQFMRFS